MGYEKIFLFALGVLVGFVLAVIVACLEASSIDDADEEESMDDYTI